MPINLLEAQKLVDSSTTLFWFRRDLRIDDNAGLFHALKEKENVLPLFIFDSNILDKLEDSADARLTFIHGALQQLHADFQKVNSPFLVLRGNPTEIFKALNPMAVYTNHDYEPYGRERDDAVGKILGEKSIPFKTYKDHVIFEKDEICKSDGLPYSIFTPFSRKWKERLTPLFTKSYPTTDFLHKLRKTVPLSLPSLAEIGFSKAAINFPDRTIKMSIISNYARQRDFPGMASTTKLGVHLRFGTVSIRTLARIAQKKSETWLNELIWREFYHMILWHHPHAATNAFKAAYDRIQWKNDYDEFQKWCDGMTGYPIVDAGMRELNATGFMHNRVRMIAASFLTKHLLIDWRWGEAYFAKKLLDFDLAANNGGWQWAAGSGCDAAPYFRVFNPYTQARKFDPKMTYILKWVPEVGSTDYPRPMVDHNVARKRVIEAYQKTLR